jgi:hypothetical protein
LIPESSATGNFPPFFKANMETGTVTLNGNKDHYKFSGMEFQFRLIAELIDGSLKNDDYTFVIRTTFKNSAPRFQVGLVNQ